MTFVKLDHYLKDITARKKFVGPSVRASGDLNHIKLIFKDLFPHDTTWQPRQLRDGTLVVAVGSSEALQRFQWSEAKLKQALSEAGFTVKALRGVLF